MKKIFGNKKMRFVAVFVMVAVIGFSGYLIVRAFTVSDSFSDATKVSATWHTEVDTGAGVARLATKSCDNGVWYCGAGYNDVIANDMGDGAYIVVARADLASAYRWKTTQTACDRPQCSTDGGADGDNLKADNTLSFSAYPARDACKTIGGRLPTKTELLAIYTNRTTFGSPTGNHWSATEFDASVAWLVGLSDGVTNGSFKDLAYSVRCVFGW